MNDIIKDAAEALQEVEKSGIHVVQGWYREDIKETHVTLWDCGETEDSHSDDTAEGDQITVKETN